MIDHKEIFVMNLKGALDSVTAADFKKYLEKKIAEGFNKYLLQCEELEFVTSVGISSLLQMKEETENLNYAFAMTGLNSEIVSLFELLGIFARLPVFKDRTSAEKYLENHAVNKKVQGQGFSFHPAPGSEKKLYVEESFVSAPKMPKEEKTPEVHHYSQKEDKTDSIFFKAKDFSSRIIACESCSSRLRINKTGLHKCPGCGIEFDVRQNGSVTYFEKLQTN